MTIDLNGSQLIAAAALALVGPVATAVLADWRRSERSKQEAKDRLNVLAAAEALRAEQHRQNLERFDKIEAALGIENPDEVAFMRASDGRRIESQISEILRQLGNGALSRFALRDPTEQRFHGIEQAAIGDHAAIRRHGEELIEVKGRVETLRRDVNGLMTRE